MMLTAIPTSTFTSSRHEQVQGGMEKVATAAAATPHLVPMAAVQPPHFLIGPGGGYTFLPSMAPLSGSESFASLRPIGQFTAHGRPITAIPYYAPGELYQRNLLSGIQNDSNTQSASTPPERKPTVGGFPPSSSSPLGSGSGESSESITAATPETCTPESNNPSPKEEAQLEEEQEMGADVKTELPVDEPVQSSCARRNSDSKIEEVSTKSNYPINALIDVPVPTSLSRSSRTSSLSSSLSSFRFGGSLSTLWASQLSLSGARISGPSMKSTGNLTADAAALPSLGNQYYAFGGSLPELSLTSLTRLLPNSSANDTSITSCPSLFTLFHSPLYVYPSQQHLATPFINTHGSITFGSFLSSGSSLSNSQAAQKTSTSDDSNSNTSPTDITGEENKVDESVGAYGRSTTSSSTLCSSSQAPEVKLPSMYSSPIGALGANVITALPAFSTLTPANLDTITSHSVSTHSPHLGHLYPSTTTTQGSDLNTLACVASAQHQRMTSEAGLPDNTSPGAIGHASSLSPLQSTPDSKEGILAMDTQPAPELFLGGRSSQSHPSMNGGDPSLTGGGSDIKPSMLSPRGHGYRGAKKEKERPYKCDHPGCERSFSFPAHLRSHIQQIHISYRPCQCEFPGCGKRFYTPQHLNVHRRVHTGERPFICPYADCVKAFTTAGNLKNHIRTHTGERPYICKFEGCIKRFAEMSSLKKHELTHTGEKPYKCRVCGKAFSQAGSRNTHERKHSRTDEEEVTDGKLSRRYRIKRVDSSPKEEPL